MDKRIIYTTPEGSVSVVVPAPDYIGTLETLASKVVPEGLDWRIVDVAALPASRNWRNAWTDAEPTETVDIDLERAKVEHIELVRRVLRVTPELEAEISALQPAINAAATLTELYNIWPDSAEKRSGTRPYVVHKPALTTL
jgi:hypothetical protein